MLKASPNERERVKLCKGCYGDLVGRHFGLTRRQDRSEERTTSLRNGQKRDLKTVSHGVCVGGYLCIGEVFTLNKQLLDFQVWERLSALKVT